MVADSMKKISSSQNENVFKSMVRSVVKEELIPVKEELIQVEKRLDYKWNMRFAQFEDRFDELEDKFNKLRNDVMTGIDQITGMFKKHDDEHQILSSQHQRLIDMEDKVESLEKIHPQGQHIVV